MWEIMMILQTWVFLFLMEVHNSLINTGDFYVLYIVTFLSPKSSGDPYQFYSTCIYIE